MDNSRLFLANQNAHIFWVNDNIMISYVNMENMSDSFNKFTLSIKKYTGVFTVQAVNRLHLPFLIFWIPKAKVLFWMYKPS